MKTVKRAARLAVDGTADHVRLEKLRDRLRRHVQGRTRQVIFDLMNAPAARSSVLAFLMEARAECERHGVEMTLTGISDGVRDILRLTRLDQVLSEAEDVSSDARAAQAST